MGSRYLKRKMLSSPLLRDLHPTREPRAGDSPYGGSCELADRTGIFCQRHADSTPRHHRQDEQGPPQWQAGFQVPVVGYHDLVDSECCHSYRSIFLCFTGDSFPKDDCSCDSTGTCGRACSSANADSIAHTTGFAISTIFPKGDPDSQTYPNAITYARARADCNSKPVFRGD